MTDEPGKRLYDAVEASRLLRRAAEIESSQSAPRPVGLSLAEIEKVAAEAGLAPEAVRSAAAELDAAALDDGGVNIWGGPLRATVARVVRVPMTEKMWESIVAEIRRTYGDPGKISEWGRSMEWSYDGPDIMTVHISVSALDGATKIEAFWNQPVLAAPVYTISSFLAVIGVLSLVTALGPNLPAAAAVFAVVSAMFLLARFTLHRMATRQKDRLGNLVARLGRLCHDEASEHLLVTDGPGELSTADQHSSMSVAGDTQRDSGSDRRLTVEDPGPEDTDDRGAEGPNSDPLRDAMNRRQRQ
jgi:hypothetical protein